LIPVTGKYLYYLSLENMRFIMTKVDERVEELLAKHPSLTKIEAIKIVTEKNARKRKKKADKTEKRTAKKLKYEANLPERR
jgi:DNA gyrase/topoisomerase IV subunit B